MRWHLKNRNIMWEMKYCISVTLKTRKILFKKGVLGVCYKTKEVIYTIDYLVEITTETAP